MVGPNLQVLRLLSDRHNRQLAFLTDCHIQVRHELQRIETRKAENVSQEGLRAANQVVASIETDYHSGESMD
ncbi:hypothetical protein [Synechococcus sp. M16CYN]|uniref:hypothetical protein n=1 Tax=Synechococcus sp. M16CYN TaxID=3103139 RepID=UPI0032447F08